MNHDSTISPHAPSSYSGAVATPTLGTRSTCEPAQDMLEQPESQRERPVAARLDTMRGMLLALVRRDGRDLTARQLTAFMTVYLDSQVYTVSSMAEMLNISRPGVTRLLDRLAEYDLVARQEDRYDRRRVLIRRTSRGSAFLRELEDIARAAPALVHA